MTKTTNEPNEHIYTTHGAVVCVDNETFKLIWQMSLEDVSQMRSRLSTLEAAVEERDTIIKYLREALRAQIEFDYVRDTMNECDYCHGDYSGEHKKEHHATCEWLTARDVARALLAETAPKVQSEEANNGNAK